MLSGVDCRRKGCVIGVIMKSVRGDVTGVDGGVNWCCGVAGEHHPRGAHQLPSLRTPGEQLRPQDGDVWQGGC